MGDTFRPLRETHSAVAGAAFVILVKIPRSEQMLWSTH
jgi:hypothetical protein